MKTAGAADSIGVVLVSKSLSKLNKPSISCCSFEQIRTERIWEQGLLSALKIRLIEELFGINLFLVKCAAMCDPWPVNEAATYFVTMSSN